MGWCLQFVPVKNDINASSWSERLAGLKYAGRMSAHGRIVSVIFWGALRTKIGLPILVLFPGFAGLGWLGDAFPLSGLAREPA